MEAKGILQVPKKSLVALKKGHDMPFLIEEVFDDLITEVKTYTGTITGSYS
jgi:hypothetical protein